MSARAIARALGGKEASGGWLCCCPVPRHGKGRGDRSPSLAVRDEPGGGVSVRCFAGCRAADVVEELRRLGAWDGGDALPARGEPSADEIARRKADAAARTAMAMRIWKNTVRARGTLAEAYLSSRGIEVRPPLLRYHPSLLHKPTATRWPAMVALVQDAGGRPVAVHRTFLARDGCGKAAVEKPKMMLGPCAGGAIRLALELRSLMVSEGIENCLSAMQATGRGGWAAGAAGFMQQLVLPAAVREVTILADADEAGEDAARAAARRWLAEDRVVRIARPPRGKDFNDLLMEAAP